MTEMPRQVTSGEEFRLLFGPMPDELPEEVSTSADHGNVARLRHHADRLDSLIQTLTNFHRLPGPPFERSNQAVGLYRDIRVGLRRDYDAGDRPKLSKAETLSQHALYGAFVELRTGVGVPSQLLAEAQKARRVIAGAVRELGG